MSEMFLKRAAIRPVILSSVLVLQGLRAAPTCAQGTAVTLDSALSRASTAHPRVIGAAAAVDQARGAARMLTVIPNPAVQFEAGDVAPSYKLQVIQPLSWLARRGADAVQGRASIERARAEWAQVLADVARDVRRAFYAALAANERLRYATDELGIADSVIVAADRRVAAGDISALERDQLAQERAIAQLDISRAREESRVAIVELSRAIGATPGTLTPSGSLDADLDTPISGAPALTPLV